MHLLQLCFLVACEEGLADQLNHFGVMIRDHTVHNNHRKNASSSVSIGAGCPPVAMRLVRKIASVAFIEMSDLLPERMGIHRRRDDHKSKHSKCSLSILEWLQYFSAYVSVVSRQHIPDLIGYQSLIIDASMEYKGGI